MALRGGEDKRRIGARGEAQAESLIRSVAGWNGKQSLTLAGGFEQKRMLKVLQVGCALILSVMAAAAQDPPPFYAFGKFSADAVYAEADLKGLVGRELPSPSYLEGRFVYLGFIKGRQLFSTFHPGLTDPHGIAFGNVLMAVAFHGNALPGLEAGKVIVSTPNGPRAPGVSPEDGKAKT